MVRSKPTVPDMNTQTPIDPSADPDEIERLEAEAVNAAWKRKPLYEARKKIFPKRAEGTYRRFKWLIMLVTLGIYYLTPWLRWDRGPHAPDQAVLVDMANRRFYFFFIEIWPHEFFFVAGMLVMAGIGLFLSHPRWDAHGAAIPARRPSGSTCSSWSNASSKASAMRGSNWTRRRGALKSLETLRQAHRLAVDRHIDRWCVDLLFCRCANPADGLHDRSGASGCLHDRGRADRHHLHFRRADARAGLHLHVPVATRAGGHAG
jgi:hypothetical protein